MGLCVKCILVGRRTQFPFPAPPKPDVMLYTHCPNTWEAQEGESEAQGHSQKPKDILGYRVSSSQSEKRESLSQRKKFS